VIRSASSSRIFFTALALFCPLSLFAQGAEVPGVPPLIAQTLILTFLALLPWLTILLTSYIKMIIVLSLLRQATGVQNAPPNQVLNGIALVLAIYVMFPTGYQMYQDVKPLLNSSQMPSGLLSEGSAEFAVAVIDAAKEPLRSWLIKNTNSKEQKAYYNMAYRFFPPETRSSIKPTDFIVMVPAFITTQVQDAFQIGVLIYLPFFIVDLVTSNILLAMGMMMLSPTSISLPLKLLLLVMMDGWSLVLQGLMLSFKP
jgi:type III secretion protein R